jgi:hypothetical protein
MRRPTRASVAGSAYLDLQGRARRERRSTQELLTLYVVERWLARLSMSGHASKFVIKGGMLLAAYDARRPTADLDALARSIADDQSTVLSLVSEVADLPLDDGVEFRTGTATSRLIREQAIYSGVRVAMDAAISTAAVRFRIDVNFGDPVTPGPGWVVLPRRCGRPWSQSGCSDIPLKRCLPRRSRRPWSSGQPTPACATQGTRIQPISAAVGNFAELRRQTYNAYRAALGDSGQHLPSDLGTLVGAVAAFADPLTRQDDESWWQPRERRWSRLPN